MSSAMVVACWEGVFIIQTRIRLEGASLFLLMGDNISEVLKGPACFLMSRLNAINSRLFVLDGAFVVHACSVWTALL
jgi:hypothetical protein